jgi:hypothetical protein
MTAWVGQPEVPGERSAAYPSSDSAARDLVISAHQDYRRLVRRGLPGRVFGTCTAAGNQPLPLRELLRRRPYIAGE